MAERKQRDWAQRLQSFDRRWLFFAMLLAIVVPLFFPLGLPIVPSPMVKSAFYTVEELDEGDTVFISLDLDPASTPELEPFYRAVILQLKRKGVKVVVGTTWYAAPPLIERWISETLENQIVDPDEVAPPGEEGYSGEPDRAYEKNEDYVWLGFREGRQALIERMADDLRGAFDGEAADGTKLSQIEMMDGIQGLADFDLVILVSAGFPGIKEYVQQAQGRGDVPMIGSCTAVSTTDYAPYYNSKQILGLVGGMAKAAEYEKLVGVSGQATEGADVLNFGHLVVIGAIIFGNFIYFFGRRRRITG